MVEEIGRYEVRRRLGAGGFGTVVEAYDPVLDGSVAIKILADNLQHRRRRPGALHPGGAVLRALRR